MLRTALFSLLVMAQAPVPAQLIRRHYVEGDQAQYLMKGDNDGTKYEVRLTSIVKKGADGTLFEEYAWSDAILNGRPRVLSPRALSFRLAVNVQGPGTPFVPPDLSKTPGLIGPVTDLMTFAADEFLSIGAGAVLRQPGDHFYFANPVVSSFADGNVVLTGEDAIDFDITVTSGGDGAATLLVKHVPPREPKIHLVADWMQTPIADTPNNYAEVSKTLQGYSASVGKETFDVVLRIDLADGKILSATIDNPVAKVTRDCADEALTRCGPPRADPTLRRIEMSLLAR